MMARPGSSQCAFEFPETDTPRATAQTERLRSEREFEPSDEDLDSWFFSEPSDEE